MAIFELLSVQFGMMYVNETVSGPSSLSKSMKNWHLAHVEAGESCGFIPDVPWSTSNASEQKGLDRITFSNFPEIRSSGIF